MFFKQYYLGCLSHASYLIADEDSGDAVVVDPQRDIEQYVSDAEEHSFQIKYVILTHFHADFLAGHIELRDQLGAQICLGARAEAEFEFKALKENDVIQLGQVRLQALETPGHTPEGISILVYDLEKSDKVPQAVLTGDTLFVGDVGRPDLLASIGVTAEELSEMLYDSIQNKLAKLPDETMVYPAHGAGSLCGRNLSSETVSTIGEQKQYNYAMQPMSLQEFQKVVLQDQPEAPDYFVHDAILNRKERASLAESMKSSMHPMSLETVLGHHLKGAQIVDVRNAIDFEGAHLSNAINIGLQGQFASWAGTILNKDVPIIVIADRGEEEEAIMRLGRIGFDNVIGFLEGGMAAVGEKDALLHSTERITMKAAYDQLRSKHPPVVLDVRTSKEREAGSLPESVNIPLNELSERYGELGKNQPLIVHCQGGYRSAIACSLLQHYGFEMIQDLVGGFSAWKSSDLPSQPAETSHQS